MKPRTERERLGDAWRVCFAELIFALVCALGCAPSLYERNAHPTILAYRDEIVEVWGEPAADAGERFRRIDMSETRHGDDEALAWSAWDHVIHGVIPQVLESAGFMRSAVTAREGVPVRDATTAREGWRVLMRAVAESPEDSEGAALAFLGALLVAPDCDRDDHCENVIHTLGRVLHWARVVHTRGMMRSLQRSAANFLTPSPGAPNTGVGGVITQEADWGAAFVLAAQGIPRLVERVRPSGVRVGVAVSR